MFSSIVAEFFVANVVIFPTDLAEFAGKLREYRGVPSTLAEYSKNFLLFPTNMTGFYLKLRDKM